MTTDLLVWSPTLKETLVQQSGRELKSPSEDAITEKKYEVVRRNRQQMSLM